MQGKVIDMDEAWLQTLSQIKKWSPTDF
ncbi:hypothetical protein NTG1052_310008 [Candidatus Nitrotoga sp. 1052]|nr:hypothetical protein NTG1052_310008 [Candidatus Nitrotoga sp. 1052]